MPYKTKEKKNAYMKEWVKNNPEKAKKNARRRHIKYKYKVTEEEYDECMSTSVVCEICDTTKDLVYDHDHDTMEFRGVLCRSCNRHLGGLGDNLKSILRVVEYLNK